MKEKFIRIISPITLAVIAVLDAGVLFYAIYAIKRLINYPSTPVILFAALDAVALIIAILVTKEVLSNGVKFYDDEFEFTMLDENNIFEYSDIEKIAISKDTSASLKKDFFDRSSIMVFTLKEGKELTIDLGYTSKKSLEAVANEIKERSGAELSALKKTEKEDEKKDD